MQLIPGSNDFHSKILSLEPCWKKIALGFVIGF